MFLAIFGLAVTVLWLLAGAWYAWAVIGLDNLLVLMPIELGLVMAGLFGPLVLLWLTLAFLYVTQRLRRLEDSIWEINALRLPRIEAGIAAGPPGEGQQTVAPQVAPAQAASAPPPDPRLAEPVAQVQLADGAELTATAQAGTALRHDAAELRACDVSPAVESGPDFDAAPPAAAPPQIEVPPPIETAPPRAAVQRRAVETAPAAAAATPPEGPDGQVAASVTDRPIGFRHRVRVTAKELNDVAMDLSTALSDESEHARALETFDQGNGDVFFELLYKVLGEHEPETVIRHLTSVGAAHLLGDYAETFDGLLAESKKVDRSGTLGRSVETMPIGRLNTRVRAVLAAAPSH